MFVSRKGSTLTWTLVQLVLLMTWTMVVMEMGKKQVEVEVTIGMGQVQIDELDWVNWIYLYYPGCSDEVFLPS